MSALDKSSAVPFRDIVVQEMPLEFSLLEGPVRVVNGVVVRFFSAELHFAARYCHAVADQRVTDAGILVTGRRVALQRRDTGFPQ